MLIAELIVISAIYGFIASQFVIAKPRRKTISLTRADEITFKYRFYAKATTLQLKGGF